MHAINHELILCDVKIAQRSRISNKLSHVTWIAPRCGNTSIVLVLSGEGVRFLLLLKYCSSRLQPVSLFDESLTGEVSLCSSPEVHFTCCCVGLKHCGLRCFERSGWASSHSIGLGDPLPSELAFKIHLCCTNFGSVSEMRTVFSNRTFPASPIRH